MPLSRRFHVGDVLAVALDAVGLAPRGTPGMQALVAHMTRYGPFRGGGGSLDDWDRVRADLQAALIAAYPALGAYTRADIPGPELLPAWRRRRARELGRYLTVPQLPPAHPLLAPRPGPVEDWSTFTPFPADPIRDPAGTACEVCLWDACDEGCDRVRGRGVGSGGEQAAHSAVHAAGHDAAAGVGRDPGRAPGRAGPDDPHFGGGLSGPGTEAAAGAAGPGLRRRFHVGDLLAVVTGCLAASPQGRHGVEQLAAYMADRGDRALSAAEWQAHAGDFRAALLAAYPELGAYAAADVPPREFLPLWRRRREHELGRYISAPRLPGSHPLRTRHVRASQAAPQAAAGTRDGTAGRSARAAAGAA